MAFLTNFYSAVTSGSGLGVAGTLTSANTAALTGHGIWVPEGASYTLGRDPAPDIGSNSTLSSGSFFYKTPDVQNIKTFSISEGAHAGLDRFGDLPPLHLMGTKRASDRGPASAGEMALSAVETSAAIMIGDPCGIDDQPPKYQTMPMTMSMSMRMSLIQALLLDLKMEQRLIMLSSMGMEEAGEDALGYAAPEEYYKTLDIILKMSGTKPFSEYVKLAEEAFKSLDRIGHANFRLRAMCKLCEELHFQPELRKFVAQAYQDELGRASSETNDLSEKFSLALFTAASMARAGVDPEQVRQLTERAFGIARSEDDHVWSPLDRQSFNYVLDYMAGKSGHSMIVKKWLKTLVGEPMETVTSPAEAADSERISVPETDVPFLHDLLLIKLMDARPTNLLGDQGTFNLFMHLVTDRWEGIAAHVYALLSQTAGFRQALEGALPNFSSIYYRKKAEFVMDLARYSEDPNDEDVIASLKRLAQNLIENLNTDGPSDAQHILYEQRSLGTLFMIDPCREFAERIPCKEEMPPEDILSFVATTEEVGKLDISYEAIENGLASFLRKEVPDVAGVIAENVKAAFDAPPEEPVKAPEEENVPDPKTPGLYHTSLKEDEDTRKNIVEYLYQRLGVAMFEGQRPFMPGSAKVFLAGLKEKGGPRAVIEGLKTLPEALLLDSGKNIDEAEALVSALTGIFEEEPYYQGLALILVRLRTHGVQFKDIKSAIAAFLKVAKGEQDVATMDIILDAVSLYRSVMRQEAWSPLAGGLLSLIRGRARLINKELKERIESKRGEDEIKGNEGSDDAKEMKMLRDIEDMAAAQILSFGIDLKADTEDEEGSYTRKIRERYPANAAWAAFARAEFLSSPMAPASRSRWIEAYVNLGIESFKNVADPAARAMLIRELASSLSPAFFKKFDLKRRLFEAMDDDYMLYELKIAEAFAGRHRMEEGCFGLEHIAEALRAGAVDPAAMSCLLTNKAVNRLVQKGMIGDLAIARIYAAQYEAGQMNQNAVKWAIDAVMALENKGAEASGEHIHLISKIISSGSREMMKFVLDRCEHLIDSYAGRLTGWDKVYFQLGLDIIGFPVDRLNEKLIANSFSAGDEVYVMDKIASTYILGKEASKLYEDYKKEGKGGLFIKLFKIVRKNMPGMEISKEMLDIILSDPNFKNGEGLQELAARWYGQLKEFEAMGFRKRIKALHENDVLRKLYFHQNIGRTYFRNGPYYTYDEFRRDIEHLATAAVRYNHAPVERYEVALERHEPTSDEERRNCLSSLDDLQGMDAADKNFVRKIIVSKGPLSAADIERLEDIRGKRADVIDLLPPNRQRILNLYMGLPPLAQGSEGLTQEGEFEMVFRPGESSDLAPMKMLQQLNKRFVEHFHTLSDLIRADYVLGLIMRESEAGRLGEKAPLYLKKLDGLMKGNGTVQDLLENLKTLYLEIENDIAPAGDAPKKDLSLEIEGYMDTTALNALRSSGSLLYKSSNQLKRDEGLRLKTNLGYEDIEPYLPYMSLVFAEDTEERKAIRRRLGVEDDDMDKRLDVEVELVADAAKMSSHLKEKYLPTIAEHMTLAVKEYREADRFFSDAGKGFKVRMVPRADILTFLQMGNFRPCCISTNGMCRHNLPNYYGDLMTLPFVVSALQKNEGLGHMIGHLGLVGNEEGPGFLLNGVYMRVPHRSPEIDNGDLGILKAFAEGAAWGHIRHGDHSYHDLSQKPPAGYHITSKEVVRLQTLMGEDGEPIKLYNDLGLHSPNKTERATHYGLRITKKSP